ncbi:MAG: HEPN domain-containing protein [Thiocapsa sp.]|uniref:HEPN domain-containing protein n=1 Tax=Thiocapsa sp. TaxID=2024551 RepID=UPI001BCAADE4|nr:HEPN domain-containing protein [Thiocapsa sp.]QVL50166.1 MAG: HEPN domain-containing protein [Thiocapsa sp.]
MLLDEITENLKQKYSDAVLLIESQRYSNAIYLTGYCVELALKYAIAKHLNWQQFRTEGELRVLKSHNFFFLLQFTGKEDAIKANTAWHVVSKWRETNRYEDPRRAVESDARGMLAAARTLVEDLCEISL